MKDQKESNGGSNNNEVINLDQFRNRKSEEKKRKTERIFFHQLVGVYSELKPGVLFQVDMIDVSEDGLAIQIPYQSEKVWPTNSKDVPIRLYFTAENFMEILVDVKNTRPTIEGGVRYNRFGCSVQTEHRSYEAWKQFVNFLRAFTDVSEKDSGNIGIGNL